MLRTDRHSRLGISEVAAVTEVLIATAGRYFNSLDTALYQEFNNLSEHLSSMHEEIAKVQAGHDGLFQAAQRLAENVHGTLADCAGLLVAGGEMGELIAGHLHDAGLARLVVTARLARRAEMLARDMVCHHAPFDSLPALVADADIVVWDPEKEKTISAKSQQSAIDYNVFEGKHVKGLPRFTLTRGRVAVEDGAIQPKEGHGQFVAREPFQAVNKALSKCKELTTPRKVERSGIPASGV